MRDLLYTVGVSKGKETLTKYNGAQLYSLWDIRRIIN